MSCRCRMPQKTAPIAAIPKNTAIDNMYSGGPKKRHNIRHIAVVFTLAAIVQISCSVIITINAQINIECHLYQLSLIIIY